MCRNYIQEITSQQNCEILAIHENSPPHTVYRENFAPVLFLSLSPSLSPSEFKSERNCFFSYLSFKTTVSGRIQNGEKPSASVEKQK